MLSSPSSGPSVLRADLNRLRPPRTEASQQQTRSLLLAHILELCDKADVHMKNSEQDLNPAPIGELVKQKPSTQ